MKKRTKRWHSIILNTTSVKIQTLDLNAPLTFRFPVRGASSK